MSPDPLSAVARVIQLAVAPVFLLTALGTTLGVLSTRLARIVDRARRLGERTGAVPPDVADELRADLRLLSRRRRLVNGAITAAVLAALLVCILIAAAFVGSMGHADLSRLVATLFVLAMLAYIVALLAFLAEVLLASRSVRFEPLTRPSGGSAGEAPASGSRSPGAP